MGNYWIYENHTEGYEVRWKLKSILHEEKTAFQKLAVVDTLEWGKALILDGALQIAEKDEFIYHEMIVHVPIHAHPHPERVLIIGGGDGGTLREVVRHATVKKIDMVEIDERVVKVSQQYFPKVASAFDDPRLNLHIGDGIKYVAETTQEYDLVIVDSSDPVGPAVQLFSRDFYQSIYSILAEDGMVTVQSESPIFFEEAFRSVHKNMGAVFPKVNIYLASIPTYVSGPWTFTIGSKKHNPVKIQGDRTCLSGLKYYNESVHEAAFSLPQFIKSMVG